VTIIDFMTELHRLGIGLRLDGERVAVQAPRGALTPELRARLHEYRHELVSILADADAAESEPIQPVPRDRPLPVSYAQRRLWFLDRLDPGGAHYNVPTAIRLGGPVDEEALHAALDGLVARHEALRTTFPAHDGVPYQRVHPPTGVFWRVGDASAAADPLREAEALVADDATAPFDLEQGPLLRARLIRLGPTDRLLSLVMHHIVCDEWSAAVVKTDLAALYRAARTGDPVDLPPLPIQYGDYAAWQRRHLRGQRRQRLLGYWRRQLSGLVALDLPTDRVPDEARESAGEVVEFTVPGPVSAGLRELGRQHGSTVFMTLLAAFQALLARYTGRGDIAVGTPVAGRDRAELEPLIGFFVNTLVLRADLAGDPTFAEILRRTRAGAVDGYAHQELPFELLVEDLSPDRDATRHPLFNVMFRLERHRGELELERLDACELPVPSHTAKFDLTMALTDGADGLWGGVEYATGLFDRATVETFVRCYLTLLAGAVADPRRRLSELPLLDEASRAELDRAATGPPAQHPVRTVPELISRQVADHPDSVAVVADDARLTYRDLAARTSDLARALRTEGVGPESVVAVCLERSSHLVVGLLAVFEAGGAYLPLDPAQPPARLRQLLADARPVLVLVEDATADRLAGVDVPLLSADRVPARDPAGAAPGADSMPVHAERAAYVIYTSGSTGSPKAVVVTHRALSNVVTAVAGATLDGADRAVLAVTTVAFDIAAIELFMPLVTGAAVMLARSGDARDPRRLAGLLARPEVGVAQATPTSWRMLLDAGWAGRADLVALCGGEALPGGLADRLRSRVAAVHNLYGPTETTVWSTAHPTGATDDPGTTPIGRPLAGTTCRVLDEHGNPVPPGVIGELAIAGAGLARGYRGRPDLTAERFVADPLGAPGTRLYRTGDRVRHGADGVLRFVGRVDDQLKIRGYRVEPAEVEGVLADHTGVAAAAVTARPGPDGTRRLVAHVVAHPSGAAGTRAELAADLTDRWRQIWETAVDPAPADPAFDLAGWVASDTGEPIPAEHMREWVDTTVARIRRLHPKRVLEIGCGTGLLLWRLAPDSVHYTATDLAEAPLRALARRLPRTVADRVRLLHREATDLAGLDDGGYDVVILNSVTQYFPSAAYLRRVLAGSLRLARPGGFVFLGDLRNLPLLPLQRDRAARRDETELLVDPRLFHALRPHLPQLAHVQVLPKAGRHHNELTRFRYDAILHTVRPRLVDPDRWLHWTAESLTLDRLHHLVTGQRPRALGLRQVPNARLHPSAVEPEDLVGLGESLGYAVELSCSAGRPDGSFDAVLLPPGIQAAARFPEPEGDGPPETYTNDPVAARVGEATRRELATAVRAFAAQRLPDYLVPSVVDVVDGLPLTPNGKVDRRALPDPREPRSDRPYEAPATVTERAVAEIWCEVLGAARVGRWDDFFALGGHSLLATQVASRVEARLGAEVPLRALFAHPTVSALAHLIDTTGDNARFGRVDRAERGERPPLSFAQQRVWFVAQLRPESPEYNVAIAARLLGALSVEALRDALNEVVARHEILRTTFPAVDGVPAQVVHDREPIELAVTDVTDDEAREVAAGAAVQPFDLAAGPLLRARLLRTAPTEHVLLLATHHIVCDDWSIQILTRELTQLYEASGRGEAGVLAPLPVQYADFTIWQRRWLTADRLERQLAYWRQRLADLPSLDLPTDRPYPPVRDAAAGWVEFAVPGSVRDRLRRVARDHNATMFMALLTAFASLLRRYTGATDIPIGTPVAGRTHPDLEPLIGLFVNTLVLRVDLSGTGSFAAALRRVRDTALGAYAHQDLPFEQLVEHLAPQRDRGRHPLFQVLLNYTEDEQAPTAASAADTVTAEPFGGPAGTAKFDLRLVVRDGADGLRAALQYRRDIFDQTTAGRMASHLAAVLHAVAADPYRPLDRLPALTAPQRERLAALGAGPAEPVGAALPTLFDEQVRRAPDADAVTDHRRTLTYRELDSAAARLARSLAAYGVGPDTVVALLLPHGADLPVAVLGTWRAGGAYLALNPMEPLHRIAQQLHASGASVVVTTDELIDAVPATTIPVLPLGPQASPPDPPSRHTPPPGTAFGAPHPDSLAYVVFTSGSTGAPKPVGVTHRGLADYTRGIARRIEPLPAAGWALAQPLSVDLGVTGLAVALACGGRLRMVRPAHLIEDLVADPADYLKITPTHLALLLDQPTGVAALPRRALVLGGEPTPPRLLAALRRTGWTGQVYGHYGPAETTVGATASRPADDGVLPLGTPLPNVSCHVVDRAGEPVPLGARGELLLAGPGLARGYLGRPDLTAERFVADPFAADGTRLYRTGDRVRWRAGSVLEFAGRVDDQLNLNGFRVEPGEVSGLLTEHPLVRAATVDLRPDRAGIPRLVAWVAPAVPDGLRTWTADRLPSHLVPAEFVPVPALPLTANGKLDRRGLPDPVGPAASMVDDPPAGPTEWTLAALWGQALGVADVNRGDDFFDLGGHSLLAAQVVARIPALFGVDLPLTALFDHPTLADLAACVDAAQAAPRPASGRQEPALVVLNRRPGRPRLFCAHPLSGSTFCFRPIAAGLGDQLEFVGLQARGLTDDQPPFERITDMAASYVSAIRELQPDGPYLIAGWSFGSMVALEIAQQLVAGGQRVDFLGLIGPTNIRRRHGTPEIAAGDVGRLRDLVRRLVADGATERDDLALAIHPLVCEPEFAGEPSRYDPDLLFRRLRLLAAHRGAAARYRPRPYPGSCTLVMPQARHDDDEAVIRQWRGIARGGVALASVPGDHLSMVMEPANAQHVARLLRELLSPAR
jgi:amino acid adenylation domain-containing protein